MNKCAIVTGAAGFAGYTLVEHLCIHGYRVYAVVRPSSSHNKRLAEKKNVILIEMDMRDAEKLKESPCIKEIKNVGARPLFFHLAWGYGGRYDFEANYACVEEIIKIVRVAADIGCTRFIATGSQAEYGAIKEVQVENMMPVPFCDYGACKVAACILSGRVASQLGMEWVWGRIFSLYGRYEPKERLMPSLYNKLLHGKDVYLSSCLQNWDYLHVSDAAEALISLAEKGQSGEIYNVANGNYRPLKEYVELLRDVLSSNSRIIYGDDPCPFVSLQPDVSKIKEHTGWSPQVDFVTGIRDYTEYI